MKKAATKVLALLLAVIMAVACLPSNAVYVVDDIAASYTVTSAEVHNLGDGLVYNEFRYNDDRGIEQVCFTMEFNPKSSDFRSYVYHSQASHGYTIVDDVKNAQKEGLDVYAAINGDFFSMEVANYGTPIGLYGTAGKVSVAAAGLEGYNLVIAEDGTADVVYSKLVYGLTIGGTSYNTKLTAINKRSNTYSADYIYYFDSDIGVTAPTSSGSTRTELVCTITEGSLSVGGTLKGTVSAVNTVGGSTIGANQFVLSAGTGVGVESVAVGTEVELTVAESVAESKTVMENAYHFIYAYQTMKVDGHDRWASGELVNPGLSEQFAQRCVVGIKEDGTIIYMVCDGRKTMDAGTNGFDYDMIMEMMEPYNCTDIINFDGGGSTAVVVGESDGKLSYEFIGAASGTGRTVANSILIVRDPDADPIPEETYDPIVDKAGTELRNIAINKSYTLEQYGSSVPTYLSTVQGDPTGRKLTNGKYRSSENSSEALSMASIGTEHQIHMVLDLASSRDDIRNVTWRGVSTGGNRSFNSGNLIVYVSDDGTNWSSSIAGDVTKTATELDNVYDYVYSFKAAQSGRYLKLVFGCTTYAMQLDEVEVYAMVDENEPVEEPIPEDETSLPAEEPSELCENVALNCSYTMTCSGVEILPYYSSDTPRWYSFLHADATPQKLTDGALGTSGSFDDGCTLAVRSGTAKEVVITVDLGEVVDNLEFVQLLNVIDNAGSFGKLDGADISYSTDGSEFTAASCRVNSSAVQNTHYYNLTLQFNQLASARYVKITFLTPKFLIGLGELRIFTTAAEGDDSSSEEESSEESSDIESSDAVIDNVSSEDSVEESSDTVPSEDISVDNSSDEVQDVLYGDVNGDGYVDSLDAAQVLKHDAMLIELEADALLRADVNGDEMTDSLDAAQILKFDALLITVFPVEG